MPADKLLCHTIQRFYGGKQYSLQGAGGTASGAAEYTNAYLSDDSSASLQNLQGAVFLKHEYPCESVLL